SGSHSMAAQVYQAPGRCQCAYLVGMSSRAVQSCLARLQSRFVILSPVSTMVPTLGHSFPSSSNFGVMRMLRHILAFGSVPQKLLRWCHVWAFRLSEILNAKLARLDKVP